MNVAAAHRLHAEVETARPLRARGGLVAIAGWCLIEDLPDAPAVRLRTAAGTLSMSTRTDRADIPKLLPGQPAAARCGFVIEGRLPAGVHLARLEAQLPGGAWQCFKSFSLAVEARPFAADIESPSATSAVHQRVHVEGWALHPLQPVRELSLRYGHQEIPCTLDRPRTDVPAAYPDSPHAARAGFKSKVILSAGRGPLRLKATLADGSVALARCALQVDVATDENHALELSLAAPRIPLPGYDSHFSELSAPTPTGLNVLFISHGDFTANSTLQIAARARELATAGHSCVIAIPKDLNTLSYQQSPAFRGLLHVQVLASGGNFPNGRGPDIIHAWTTRESVRTISLAIQEKLGGRLVVQLEDNEQEIRQQHLSASSIPGRSADLADPCKGQEFLRTADGITLIVDSLRELSPAEKPAITIWPAADARYFYPRPLPMEFREALQVPLQTTLLFYHGNAHAANANEMRELYKSLLQLNGAGQPVWLIRAGTDQVDFLGSIAEKVKPFILNLGTIHTHRHLPPLMALADIFVQPGEPDAFNDYRFPSKLPEFFALGRPVVLPRTNLGTQVRHGIDAYVLDRADAAGIAAAVTELRRDRALHARLSQGATAFAASHFSWRRSAEALAKFYQTLAR